MVFCVKIMLMSTEEDIFETKKQTIEKYVERDEKNNVELDNVKCYVNAKLFPCDNDYIRNYINHEGNKQLRELAKNFVDSNDSTSPFTVSIEIDLENILLKSRANKAHRENIRSLTTIREIYEYLTFDDLCILGY